MIHNKTISKKRDHDKVICTKGKVLKGLREAGEKLYQKTLKRYIKRIILVLAMNFPINFVDRGGTYM